MSLFTSASACQFATQLRVTSPRVAGNKTQTPQQLTPTRVTLAMLAGVAGRDVA